MKITDLLDKKSIDLKGNVKDKKSTLNKMVDLMAKSGKINNIEKYRKGVFAREEEGTTGIGEGIAIPHCKSDAVNSPGLAAMVVPDGVEFEALDGAPVNLIFLIAAPDTEDNIHLDVLSKLSVLLMDEKFTGELKSAKSADEFIRIIDKAESGKDNEEKDKVKEQAESSDKVKILAVTGCPTGIAHTYMAAESLEKTATEMGYQIKVETRGSGGAKNVLTDKEIADACCIIVAADTQVPMERFDGKKVIQCKVADGISKAEQLIDRAVKGDASVYHASGNAGTVQESGGDGDSIGHRIYKDLMNGVSHMLPFVVGGGILIALAFLLDDYSIDPSNFGTNTPVAAWFKAIGGYAFSFMLPVLAGYIAMSIADRPGLVVGFVGGYIASVGATFGDPFAEHTVAAGFLGALFAGFAAGYIVKGVQKLCDYLPDALNGIKSILIYPLAGTLLIGLLMCAVDPAVAWLNTGLSSFLNSMGDSSKVLLGCVLGGMMSIDMGGPFNKAAYVFGTGMLAEQNESGFMIMAAVMIGGMIPPLAIAIASTFFKNKFTEEERKSGLVNYIMGLCFISEGAIPYAASDPLRVIPSCIAGSAVAGGLSMAFGCTLRAPHGGVFVFPTIGNVGGYIIALVAGSVVGAVLLGILKKKVAK
ncbi:MAG: fructose-specific PTS transporter subunit EIIC [Lachnospiraceae bacterium]|nr:fructose-specific PTS transporter subunit EIIC [Lachnospiraceae bacterium]